MGLFKDLKETSEWRKKKKREREERREAREKAVNQNPTEEELKNNKKGKLSYLWTFLSVVAYVLGFGLVLGAWQNNIAVGIMALIFVLAVTPLVQRKAVSLAQEQREINGKGRVALLLAYVLPSAILVVGFFFFVLGGVYIFDI